MKETASDVAVTPYFATLIRTTSPGMMVANEVPSNPESTAVEVLSNGAVPPDNSVETVGAVSEPLVAVHTFGKTLDGPWEDLHSGSPGVVTNGMVVAGQVSEKEKQL